MCASKGAGGSVTFRVAWQVVPSQRINPKSASSAKLACMAKSPPEKKAPAEVRVLPMDLKLGDRLADERSEWQVIGRPYTTAGGKTAHVRVESVKQPGVTEIRSWGAHERVGVRREGGNR